MYFEMVLHEKVANVKCGAIKEVLLPFSCSLALILIDLSSFTYISWVRLVLFSLTLLCPKCGQKWPHFGHRRVNKGLINISTFITSFQYCSHNCMLTIGWGQIWPHFGQPRSWKRFGQRRVNIFYGTFYTFFLCRTFFLDIDWGIFQSVLRFSMLI